MKILGIFVLAVVQLLHGVTGNAESDKQVNSVLNAMFYFRSLSRAVEDLMFMSYKDNPTMITIFMENAEDIESTIDKELNSQVVPNMLKFLMKMMGKMKEDVKKKFSGAVIRVYKSLGTDAVLLKEVVATLIQALVGEDDGANIVKEFLEQLPNEFAASSKQSSSSPS